MSFYRDDKGWGFSAGNKLKVESDAVKDEYGNTTQVINAPIVESGMGPISAGRAKSSIISVFGFNWNFSGKSSKLEPVDWKGP